MKQFNFKNILLAAVFALTAAVLSLSAFAGDTSNSIETVTYKSADSTDGAPDTTDGHGGVINPGIGH